MQDPTTNPAVRRWTCLTAVALLLGGCVSAGGPFRTGLFPAPSAPSFHGEPIGPGQVDLGVQIGGRSVTTRTGAGGDPNQAYWEGMSFYRVPELELGVTAQAGVVQWRLGSAVVEYGLGGSLLFAHDGFAAPVSGDAPPAEGGSSLWNLNLVQSISVSAPGGWLFGGLTLEIGYLALPVLAYRFDTTQGWLRGQSSELQGVQVRTALLLGTRLHERVALYAGVVLQPPPAMGETIKFEPSPDNGDFIGGSSYQLLPLVGARLDFGPSFPMYLRAALTFPLSVQGGTVHEDDPVAPDYFPVGADVALGVRL